jgi:hypothetical protein
MNQLLIDNFEHSFETLSFEPLKVKKTQIIELFLLRCFAIIIK